MAKVIEGLYYSESHEYVKVEGDEAYVGITDYAQESLGNIVYVDMPEVDDEFAAEDECVEVTPAAVRIRKVVLESQERFKIAARNRRSS